VNAEVESDSVRRVFLSFVCVFLLLFAQQSAIAHAAWHIHNPSPAQHDGNGKVGFQGELCNLHSVFGQVLGGVHVSPLQLLAPGSYTGRVERRERSLCSSVSLAYLSRAPPVLL
jgi:hypothetical protein